MKYKDEVRDLDLLADDVIAKLKSMSVKELNEQKELWEDRLCKGEIDSPFQVPKIKALRGIVREINSRIYEWRFE